MNSGIGFDVVKRVKKIGLPIHTPMENTRLPLDENSKTENKRPTPIPVHVKIAGNMKRARAKI